MGFDTNIAITFVLLPKENLNHVNSPNRISNLTGGLTFIQEGDTDPTPLNSISTILTYPADVQIQHFRQQ